MKVRRKDNRTIEENGLIKERRKKETKVGRKIG